MCPAILRKETMATSVAIEKNNQDAIDVRLESDP
ncbi:hypothetical protein P3T21_002016 [Paraburkholderia sp. GAS334]|jgi:hypothetical protein